jgi:hypothetical protein
MVPGRMAASHDNRVERSVSIVGELAGVDWVESSNGELSYSLIDEWRLLE